MKKTRELENRNTDTLVAEISRLKSEVEGDYFIEIYLVDLLNDEKNDPKQVLRAVGGKMIDDYRCGWDGVNELVSDYCCKEEVRIDFLEMMLEYFAVGDGYCPHDFFWVYGCLEELVDDVNIKDFPIIKLVADYLDKFNEDGEEGDLGMMARVLRKIS